MNKYFNTSGVCIPSKNYMVNIENKINMILNPMENGEYLFISKPRQYGKTTTLALIENKLKLNDKYLVLSTSFEGLGNEVYKDANTFINGFIILLKSIFKFDKNGNYLKYLESYKKINTFHELGEFITDFVLFSKKSVFLLIDEVDKSSNNQLFLDFLGMLRNKYIQRNMGKDYTFQSVVLAGVHDIKTLKIKIHEDEEPKLNSPWNIAYDLDIDFSFTIEEIKSMLVDYNDCTKKIENIDELSLRIFHFTGGNPFLVSLICKTIDEKIKPETWNVFFVEEAVRIVIKSKNTNFDSIIKALETNIELYNLIEKLVLGSEQISYNLNVPIIEIAGTYGLIKEENGKIKIHNLIYDDVITDYMATKLQINENSSFFNSNQSSYLSVDGRLDFKKILLKFQEVIKEKYSKSDLLKSNEFLENDLRMLFFVFLKPIINGVGFMFKEVQTSEEKRLDVVIIFKNEKFVLELKLWRGIQYHNLGLQQLKNYMFRENCSNGYLLIMDKTKHKSFESEVIDDIFIVWV
ncbi:MAG: AAA family ATPase [bacterium]